MRLSVECDLQTTMQGWCSSCISYYPGPGLTSCKSSINLRIKNLLIFEPNGCDWMSVCACLITTVLALGLMPRSISSGRFLYWESRNYSFIFSISSFWSNILFFLIGLALKKSIWIYIHFRDLDCRFNCIVIGIYGSLFIRFLFRESVTFGPSWLFLVGEILKLSRLITAWPYSGKGGLSWSVVNSWFSDECRLYFLFYKIKIRLESWLIKGFWFHKPLCFRNDDIRLCFQNFEMINTIMTSMEYESGI